MNRPQASFVAAIAGCLALVALWVSGQSFWIDECNAAVKAIQPDIRSFWATFSGMKGSDFQMPLYMFLLWGWEKVVGRAEFALRVLNILFAWSAILLVACRVSLPRRFRLFWCLAAAVSPMLAVYMDEARPYALQFLAATALFLPFVSLRGKFEINTFDFRLFSVGLLLLCASSLTGVVFAVWPCLWLFISLVRGRTLRRFLARHWLWGSIDAVLLTVLAAFYLHTLSDGARASSVGGTTLSSTVFCLYELCGFLGVGPSRLALRASQAAALQGFILPLALYAAAFVPFVVCVCFRRGIPVVDGRTAGSSILMVCLASLGAFSMLLVGVTMEMRVLARHLMPVLPALLFLFAELAAGAWGCVRFSKAAVGLGFLAFLFSCLSFRFQPYHAKDDYRRATLIACGALSDGMTVWWSADTAALAYYGGLAASSGTLCKCTNSTWQSLGSLAFPDVAILSKPDVYDNFGSIRSWLTEHGFNKETEFPAFGVFRRAVVHEGNH